MTTFIEFHTLRSFPPSNLNRDDLGSPKSALFGGSRRLRISSQCLKRTWRTSPQFTGAFAEPELGLRTNRLPSLVDEQLGPEFEDLARTGLHHLLASLGKNAKKKDGDDDEREDEANEGEDEAEAAEADAEQTGNPHVRTRHLLLLTRQEIEAIAGFARDEKEKLAKVLAPPSDKKPPKLDATVLKSLRKALKKHLDKKTSQNGVSVGLFGRFVTSNEFDTIDAALQVAHALGTQKVEVEYDYFTAVDDLSNETGAGHLGESEFASSVMYLYACCDLEQLERNLGKRTETGREADDEARALARRALPPLLRAMAIATPTGKKTGTAPYTPAEYMEVVVRRGTPLSLANSFLKPVDAREADGDVMQASIERLLTHRDSMEAAYGNKDDVLGRFVLRLRGTGVGATAGARAVKTLDELATVLAAQLAPPKQTP